jgi:hypothetical protein
MHEEHPKELAYKQPYLLMPASLNESKLVPFEAG